MNKNRLEKVREIVDCILEKQPDKQHARCGYVHLYSVAVLASQLAINRGLDPELASVAGMLHDIYTYRTKISELHARHSAEDARVILKDLKVFTETEQQIITKAISRHSDKELVHEPFDELLKDADVYQHYLYNTKLPLPRNNYIRLTQLFNELGFDSAMLENLLLE